MRMPVGPRPVAVRRVALMVGAPAVLLAAGCTPYEPVATTPGTTPSVWTGAPEPAAEHGGSHSGEGATSAAGEELTADLRAPDGSSVAEATFTFSAGYATVTVQTTEAGALTPGFHGLHIHQVGRCEANSVAPTGGAPAAFASAGGHFQVPGSSALPASGDLTSLQVRADGSAMLTTTTDAFTYDDLTAGAGTALIIHEGPDNFANIPPEAYQQVNGEPGPNANTLATGDAGGRAACGVIGEG